MTKRKEHRTFFRLAFLWKKKFTKVNKHEKTQEDNFQLKLTSEKHNEI